MKSNYILNNTIEKNKNLAAYFCNKIEDENTILKMKKKKYKELAFYKGFSFFIIPAFVGLVFPLGLFYGQSWVIPLVGAIPLSLMLIGQGKNYFKLNYSIKDPKNIVFKTKLTHEDFTEIAKYIPENQMLEIVKLQEEKNMISNSEDFIKSLEISLGSKLSITEKDKNLKNYVSSLYKE